MMQPPTIAVETSCRQGSVAVGFGPEAVADESFATNREHARELLPAVDRLCRRADLTPGRIERCFISIGPGSFTGLRVAVAFARHLALATAARIVAVPTLEVIAANCAALDPPPTNLAVILDAKRRQVYAAVFELDGEGYQVAVEPTVVDPASLFAGAPRRMSVSGVGIEYHRQSVDAAGVAVVDQSLWTPTAATVLRLGHARAARDDFTPPESLVPLYLRRPEAEEVWERRHGASGKS